MRLDEFLLARIAEDERRADCGVTAHDGSRPCDCDTRDRREIEGKRGLLREIQDVTRHFGTEPVVCTSMLMYLTLPYADHEDYRQEWRP